MTYEWLMTPIAQDAFIALPASAITIGWVVSLLKRRSKRRADSSPAELIPTVAPSAPAMPSPFALPLIDGPDRQVSPELAAMRAELQAMLPRIAPPSRLNSVNLSTRAQILRMHRRGEAPTMIAGVVGIPHNEVALMLKLDNLFRVTEEGHSVGLRSALS